MKTILVPTDFSKCSLYGLDFARRIAAKKGSTIHLFNAALTTSYYYASDPFVIAPPASVMSQSINESLNKTSRAGLSKIARLKSLSGIKVITHTEVTTNLHYEILDYADKIKADLIVMGTKGAGNLKDIFIGSTAERVARFSTKPVIVVPAPVKSDPARIVFASDFTQEAYAIFPFIRSFSQIFGATIYLLKVNTTQQFKTTGEDRKLIEKFKIKFGRNLNSEIYNDYMKEEGILNYSDQINADIIAIGTHGKKGLARFLRQNVSEGVIRLSKRPVLIVNLKKFKPRSDLR